MRTGLIVALAAVFAFQAQAAQPQIAIAYSGSMDSVCALLRGGTVKDEWKVELAARKAEFDSLWVRAGPELIATTEAIAGKPFPAGDITARLTLCNIPSQSIVGISVNMRYALRSFAATPVSMRYKVDTLFHELLHVYLSKYPVVNSALLALHASESECTRNHLHLLALQKAVLVKLQESAALHAVVTVDSQLPGGCYRQAWLIVNVTETKYLEYVAEVAR